MLEWDGGKGVMELKRLSRALGVSIIDKLFEDKELENCNMQ